MSSSDEEPTEDITQFLAAQKYASDDDADLFMQKFPKNAKKQSNKKQAALGGGSFEALGLSQALLKTLHQRGFNVPTPIQRLAMPAILDSPPRDVVGMARTGSGKTLAYLVPLVQRLGGKHSPTFGARALILVPTRELALQVLKVGKDIARGARESSDSEQLRWGMIVGGEGLEEQFDVLANNPDVIIATPGRLLHVAVESNMDFRSMHYIVFDEADRLFELGFSVQLHELLNRLPASRQTLLFSATLPKSLVEFAKAGLTNPKLVRLDADAKISADLRMAFLTVKAVEKEAALLCLLRDVIKVPLASDVTVQSSSYDRKGKGKKRKREDGPQAHLKADQAIIFTATKHHVEYLTVLLEKAGYSVSQIYGSLDQTNRKMQLANFKSGQTSLMVVTDLAARGIDIPFLQNVINYDFPIGGRSFVHRVGRTARAGQKGWAFSLVTSADLPHLFDLELFLSRPLKAAPLTDKQIGYTSNLILGNLPRDALDNEVEHVRNVLIDDDPTVNALQGTSTRGQKMYDRSSAKASPESYRRSKEFLNAHASLFGALTEKTAVHPIFATESSSSGVSRAALLAKINAFSPSETIFEMGIRGKSAGAQIMSARRKSMNVSRAKRAIVSKTGEDVDEELPENEDDFEPFTEIVENSLEMAGEDDIQAAFMSDDEPKKKRAKSDGFRDENFYIGYTIPGAQAEKGYSLNSGSFAADAANATFSLGNDDEGQNSMQSQKASTLKWDRKNKKLVRGDGVGADNKKLIRTESGARLPASFKSGKFEEWKSKKRTSIPRVGELEGPQSRAGQQYQRWKHKAVPATKSFDKSNGKGARADLTRKASAKIGRGDGQVRNMDQIARNRKLKEKRVRRSTQPSKRKKKS